jgi:hypothetical protein
LNTQPAPKRCRTCRTKPSNSASNSQKSGKVEELIKLLAIAQEQQESLVTCLKAVRSFVTSDVEICAIIDTASAEFMAK